MSEKNITSSASSDISKTYMESQCKNSIEPALIKPSKGSQNSNLKGAESGEDGDTKTMLLTDLPNEILGKVLNQVSFDDLFNLEIVCKRLQNYVLNFVWPMKDSLTHESIIQYTNYTNIPPHKKMDLMVKAVLSRSTNIRNIDLSYYSHTLKKKVCLLLSMVPNLIKLDLSHIRLLNPNLVTIAHSCPMLEEISLECCFPYYEEYNDALITLCEKCPNIKYMNLAENRIGNFFDFLPLGLLYLNLDFCNIALNDMNVLTQRAPDLETLILDYKETYEPITDMNIWLSKLTKLRFLQIDQVSPRSSIPPLDFTNLLELEKLSLWSNYLVKISTLESLQNCPKLKSLDLSHNPLDSKMTLEMLKKCKALKYCDFSEWSDLNDNLIDFVQHNQIEYLNLDNCDDKLTKDLLKSLINDCESLNYLNMWCHRNNNYSEILTSILSETLTPPRKNILKIIVHPKTTIYTFFSKCKWCKVIRWKRSDPSPRPFPDFTDVQIQ